MRQLLGTLGLCLLLSSVSAARLPDPPSVPGTGHLLMEMHSGRVLADANSKTRLEPASLTKILTGYVVFREIAAGHVQLTDEVFVSEKAWRTGGSRMFIKVNTKVPLEALLKGMIIQSGNDASVALAEHIAGSEESFADLMNEHARRLGMTESHFVNSTGLPDPNHYTTARDIALVTEATIREFPDWYRWYAIKEYTYNNIKQHNRNRLLWRDDAVDGVKTGHTSSAGYCLVASASQDDMRLVSVIMGTESDSERMDATQALLNFGFRFFETAKLYARAQDLVRSRIWKGDANEVSLGPAEDFYVTAPRGLLGKMVPRVFVDPEIVAPVHRGEAYGYVSVEIDGEEIARAPLVAMAEIPEAGLLGSILDSALLWFH